MNMNIDADSRKDKAIQQLLQIEDELEELRNSKRFISLRDSRKFVFSDETNRIKLEELSAEDKDILQVYGGNLPIEELEKVLESEPWSNGFHAATNNLIKRYDFLRNSHTAEMGRLYTPSEETINAFRASGVIPQTDITDIIESFKIPDAIAQARENLTCVYSLLKDNRTREPLNDATNYSPSISGQAQKPGHKKAEVISRIRQKVAKRKQNEIDDLLKLDTIMDATFDSEESESISTADCEDDEFNLSGQAQKPIPKRSGAISRTRRSVSKRKQNEIDAFLKLEAIMDAAKDSEESDSISTADREKFNFLRAIRNRSDRLHSNENCNKISNFFPSFLCKRTEVFMFPSLQFGSDVKPSTDAEYLSQYKNSSLKLAINTSVNAVEFCKKAKVACAMLISIFEELFCLFHRLLITSFVENRVGKMLMMDIYSELCVLEYEIVEQKRRCVKFLIDANVFLYHDPPLSIDVDSWSDQQKYIWQLEITRSKLCIEQLEVLISKLKEAQTDFIAQYKAFLCFCKLNLK